jgi:hypothetical protein
MRLRIARLFPACLLRCNIGMHPKSHIGIRAGPLLTNIGYSVADTGYWSVAIIIIAGAFLIMLLAAESGAGAKLEKGAEFAFARARQLLHEADTENRNVRPLPLSLATVVYRSAQESSANRSEAPALSLKQARNNRYDSRSRWLLVSAPVSAKAPAVDALLRL